MAALVAMGAGVGSAPGASWWAEAACAGLPLAALAAFVGFVCYLGCVLESTGQRPRRVTIAIRWLPPAALGPALARYQRRRGSGGQRGP